MSQREKNKDETFWSVLNSAIELDFRRGHQRWTMSELSRTSGVTRSLIYYYFGKSKESILLEAVKLVGEEFFGLNESRVELWQKGQIVESVLLSRGLLEKAPFMTAFYVVHRDKETDLGQSIRQLESEYRQKLQRFFPKNSPAELDALFALFSGLVMTPRLSQESVQTAVRLVLQLVANKSEPKK